MIHINGNDIAVDGIKLNDYLLKQGYSLNRIAVEINERIIPKSEYSNIILNSGDTVEIVSFVGGGC